MNDTHYSLSLSLPAGSLAFKFKLLFVVCVFPKRGSWLRVVISFDRGWSKAIWRVGTEVASCMGFIGGRRPSSFRTANSISMIEVEQILLFTLFFFLTC
jgi:hypothetical protein